MNQHQRYMSEEKLRKMKDFNAYFVWGHFVNLHFPFNLSAKGEKRCSCREEKVCMCVKERVRRAHTCPTAPRKPWNDWESLRESGPPHCFNKWAHPLVFTVVIKPVLSCLTKHLSLLPFAQSVHCAGSYSCSEKN